MTSQDRRWLDDEGIPDDTRALLCSAKEPNPTALYLTWKRLETSVGVVSDAPRSPTTRPPGLTKGVGASIAKLSVLLVVASTLGTPSQSTAQNSAQSRATPETLRVRSRDPVLSPHLTPSTAQSWQLDGLHAGVEATRTSNTSRSQSPVLAGAQATPGLASGEASRRAAPSGHGSAAVNRAGLGDYGNGVAPTVGIDAEIEWVARAQRSLETDPLTALQLADRYPSRFPTGSLRQESEVIAVDALVRLHRARFAISRAERFLTVNESSTAAPRVRALRASAAAQLEGR